MDLLLHPANVEGLPMIILEAMALGVPVMATPIGGIPDIVRDNDTGFLIREKSSADIVRRIREVRASPESLGRVASQAKTFISEYASGKHIAGLVHALIARYTTS